MSVLIFLVCRIDPRLRSTLPQVVVLLWITSLVDQVATETCLSIVEFCGTSILDEAMPSILYINNYDFYGFCDVI